MGIENITAGSTVADLDPTWPAGGESLAEADDHLRLIKKAIVQTFMNLSATVSSVASELDLAHKGGTISGNCRIKGDLSVSQNVAINGAVSISGATNIVSGLNVGGALTVSGTVVAKTAMQVGPSGGTSGSLLVYGHISANTAYVNQLSVNGSVAVGPALGTSGELLVYGHVSANTAYANSANFAYATAGNIQFIQINDAGELLARGGPSTLTASAFGTGQYRIRHALPGVLSALDYGVFAIPTTGFRAAAVTTQAAETFDVATYDAAGNLVNCGVIITLVGA